MINPLDQYYKLVRTNTSTHSVSEASSRAQVFLFCDRHNVSKYQETNARAFDYLWRSDARFFTEAGRDDHIPLSRLVNSVATWQDTAAVEKMFDEVEDTKSLILESSDVLFIFLKVIGSLPINEADASSSENMQIDAKKERAFFKSLDLLKKSSIFASLAFPKSVNASEIDSFLKSLAQSWSAYKTQMTERSDQLIEEAAILRNEMLASSLIKAHKEGATRIIAVAGSDHLRLPKKRNTSPSDQASVQNLYDALEREGIPYVTLKATNKHRSEASALIPTIRTTPQEHCSSPFLERVKAIQGDVQDIFESESVSALYVTHQIEEISIAVIEPLLTNGIKIFEGSLEEHSRKKIKTTHNGSNQ